MFAAAFFVGQLAAAGTAQALGTRTSDVLRSHLTWGLAIGQLVGYVPILAVLLPMLPWLARRTFGQLGLRLPNLETLRAATVGALGMYAAALIAGAVQYAITRQEPHEAAVSLFTSTHDRALIAVFSLIAVAAAPFVEELVFRGFLFNALLRYLPAAAAATLSALVFAASHLSLSAFVPLACSGIVLAYVYYLSGSLTASMLTHALFNAINLVLLSLGRS